MKIILSMISLISAIMTMVSLFSLGYGIFMKSFALTAVFFVLSLTWLILTVTMGEMSKQESKMNLAINVVFVLLLLIGLILLVLAVMSGNIMGIIINLATIFISFKSLKDGKIEQAFAYSIFCDSMLYQEKKV